MIKIDEPVEDCTDLAVFHDDGLTFSLSLTLSCLVEIYLTKIENRLDLSYF